MLVLEDLVGLHRTIQLQLLQHYWLGHKPVMDYCEIEWFALEMSRDHSVVFEIAGSEVKASAWNAGDLGSIPGSGRSPGEGNGKYSCLENPMEGGA